MSTARKPLSFSMCRENHTYIEEQVEQRKKTNSRYSRSMYMDDLITHLRTKQKVKRKPKTELVTVDVDGLNVKAWGEWIAYRKKAKIKAYVTDLKKIELATLGNYEEQAQIVFNSISNQYTGLFPLKNNSSSSKQVEHDSNLDDTSWANNLDDVL